MDALVHQDGLHYHCRLIFQTRRTSQLISRWRCWCLLSDNPFGLQASGITAVHYDDTSVDVSADTCW